MGKTYRNYSVKYHKFDEKYQDDQTMDNHFRNSLKRKLKKTKRVDYKHSLVLIADGEWNNRSHNKDIKKDNIHGIERSHEKDIINQQLLDIE